MPRSPEKFTTQVKAKAQADLADKRGSAGPRPHVMTAYLASHKKYGPLYKKLAKGPAT
jgi:hypothetical protein